MTTDGIILWVYRNDQSVSYSWCDPATMKWTTSRWVCQSYSLLMYFWMAWQTPGVLNAFGFSPSPTNFIRPGKRPQSSICGSIAEDLKTGEITIATGSAGGSRIITATLQELYHYLDQKLTPEQCTHHPRWHDQLSGVTLFEVWSFYLSLRVLIILYHSGRTTHWALRDIRIRQWLIWKD